MVDAELKKERLGAPRDEVTRTFSGKDWPSRGCSRHDILEYRQTVGPLERPQMTRALSFVLLVTACGQPLSTASLMSDHAALRAELCNGRSACRVVSVLDAGSDEHGDPLSVVRVAVGEEREPGCSAYSDRLGVSRDGTFHELRELARGDALCLEWSPSAWTFEGGELVFEHGGMGAPPAAGVDTRPLFTHLRPWPLAIVGEFQGDEAVTELPTLPTSGPIFVLTME